MKLHWIADKGASILLLGKWRVARVGKSLAAFDDTTRYVVELRLPGISGPYIERSEDACKAFAENAVREWLAGALGDKRNQT